MSPRPSAGRRLARVGLGAGLLALLVLVFSLTTSASRLPIFSDSPRFEVRFGSHDGETTLGAGFRTLGDWWVLANLDRLGEDAPRTSVSGVYHVPRKFFVLDIYGGPGIHFSGSDYSAHVLGGARFWILYWENEYPLTTGETTYHRAGFRIDF